ncbi:MAG: homoserine O-acetyltransferase [candidate division Zixibacteria bacterium]|nr:homoserine O-acetyltransferase [candidate division Zixibacteria bacterium]
MLTQNRQIQETIKFVSDKSFVLENGMELPSLEIGYSTLGKLNAQKDNVVWICHALTGSGNPLEWWSGLVGHRKLFDPRKYYIVCANMLGSCYGTTGPLSINPTTGEPYYGNFPAITNRDIVRANIELQKYLGIDRIHLCIGGSMGGQQVLEWSVFRPDVIDNVVLIATNAKHSPWGIAFNEAQRMAIEADPTIKNNSPQAGNSGLKAARAIGMLSYRSYQTFDKTQSDQEDNPSTFLASSYMRHQGDKLIRRFNSQSYMILLKAMDEHNVGRARGGLINALGKIKSRTLVIGISSDILFPICEQKFIANHVSGAAYREIVSDFGHDCFLIEYNQLTSLLKEFLYADH